MTVYSWKLLRAGEFRLDGGSMFGVVPRVVWSKGVPTDDRGRITVQHNCLLLERALELPPGQTGARLALIEAGSGNKLDAKSKDIFALEERSILDALHEADCRPVDIDAVVVSHLHFDHAGGLTRLPTAGEQGGPLNAVPSFPNAEIYAQLREWTDAIHNRSVMTKTYFRDHLEPIASQMKLIDSPRPFPTGSTPERDAEPMGTVATRLTSLGGLKGVRGLPGVSVFCVPGHTWGQQAVMFRDTRGRTVVFTPDVLPTAAHLGAAFSLAYDVEPYTSMVSKRWFLSAAADEDWLLVLDHEPGNPCRRVRRNNKGWFDLIEE